MQGLDDWMKHSLFLSAQQKTVLIDREHKPTDEDEKKLDRISGYLMATKGKDTVLRINENYPASCLCWRIVCSMSGYEFSYWSGTYVRPIMWIEGYHLYGYMCVRVVVRWYLIIRSCTAEALMLTGYFIRLNVYGIYGVLYVFQLFTEIYRTADSLPEELRRCQILTTIR